MKLQWPWQKIIRPDRATLTILQDGKYILGVPLNTDAETVYYISENLRTWFDMPDPKRFIIFPFPIDVVDERRS